MKIQEEELLLFVEPNDKAKTADDNPFTFFLVSKRHQFWTNDDKQIKIGDVTVSFPVPEKIGEDALAMAAINTLKERQEKVRADAHKRCTEIQEQIDNLMLLTYQPTEVIVEPTKDELPF